MICKSTRYDKIIFTNIVHLDEHRQINHNTFTIYSPGGNFSLKFRSPFIGSSALDFHIPLLEEESSDIKGLHVAVKYR